MNKLTGQADNITMSGGGLYSLATIGAKDVIDAATPLVESAIDGMAIVNPAANFAEFSLSDMGCADAGTSLAMVKRALAKIRSHQNNVPIRVIYADQPRNDFNALIRIVHGLTDFDSWIGEFQSVFPFASGTSFYNQIVPSGTLDLGFSATAMHWLNGSPGNIKGHVHMVGAEGDDLARFKQQASRDWETILRHRMHELKSGGRLVFVNFCRDEQGRYLGATGGVNMFDTFNNIWQQFLEDGRINASEYDAMTLPQYYRDVAEFEAPLKAASGEFKALTLEHIETRVVRCPFAAAFEEHQDSARFAKAYIPTIRTWNESIFFAGLATARPLQERKDLIENYYQTYEDMVRNNPEGHAMDYVHAYLSIRKD